MGKTPAFPNSLIYLNSEKLLCEYSELSVDEIGLLFLVICKNTVTGKKDEYDFIEKIILGTNSKRYIPNKIKEKVLSFGCCVYCGSDKNLEIDHIVPVSKGGSNRIDNLQCLCQFCNRSKGSKINYA